MNVISNRIVLLIALFALCLWAYPLWFTPGMMGIYDWGAVMNTFEAMRRSVLEFKQWPNHNPWMCGGQPSGCTPGYGLLSIKGFLVLLCGTFWGLRLSIVAYLWVGFIGLWKLSGLWWRERFIRLVFCFFVIANPAVTYHTIVCHLLFQTFWFMPWLLYYLLVFNKDRWAGLKAGVVFGMAFLDSPAYVVQYELAIIVCLWCWLCMLNKRSLSSLITWIVLFIPVVGTLVFYRAATIAATAVDFPRIAGSQICYTPLTLVKAFLVPYHSVKFADRFQQCDCATTWEICCYLGIVAIILAVASLRQGVRWWHVMIGIVLWATIGNCRWYHLMYWVQKLPTFSSHLCFSRIRMFMPLFLGISATSGLNAIWCKYKKNKWHGIIRISVGIFMAGEVLVLSHLIMRESHIKYVLKGNYNPEGKFKNIHELPRPFDAPDNIYFYYDVLRMNLGWLQELHGASFIAGATMRIGCDQPGYQGEFHQRSKLIEPKYWSPNKLIFDKLETGVPLTINMNPGRPWCKLAQGKYVQLFPKYRIVEMQEPFEILPESDGTLELVYRPPGSVIGLCGTAVFFLIMMAVIIYLNAQPKKERSCYVKTTACRKGEFFNRHRQERARGDSSKD